MKKLFSFLLTGLLLLLFNGVVWGQTFYQMSVGNYTQTFADIANWTNSYAAGDGAGNWRVATSVATSTVNSATVFVTGTSGGVQKGTQKLILLATGTNSTATDLLLNFTGRAAGTISLDYEKIENTPVATPRSSDLKIQYSIDNGVTFTDLTGYTFPRVLNNNTPESGSLTNIVLPAALNGEATVILRFYVWNNGQTGGSGNRPKIAIDNISITSTASSTPAITVTPSTLTNFSYVDGSGPSSEQSFSISGANLTDDISITPPTNYEISIGTGGGFLAANPITLGETGGTVDETTIYVRLKSGLSAGNFNDEEITATSTGAANKTVTCSGTVYKTEPTNHTTAFISAAGTPDYSAIDLSWTDASGGTVPDGYLIKGSSVGYGSISDPVDGTAESDGALVKSIAQGIEAATFSGLSANTTYYFKIFPYTNSGSNINYKIDGVVPTINIGTGSAPAASLLLEENFDFSGALTSNGWSAHSGGGTNVISTTTGLTYTGYANSGTGNAALLSNLGGEDLNRNFTLQNVNGTTIYVSFLVNITEASSDKTGDYFFSLGDRVTSTEFTLFAARVGVKIASDVVNFGISNTSTITYGSTSFAKNTTYLLIVKYTINSGGNDETKLWVFSTGVPSDESSAGSAEVTNTTTAGQDAIDALALRQGNATTSVQLVIDGIRISDGWSQAPLPVELTSFSVLPKGNGVQLTWATATEINNFGFEIERSQKPVVSSENSTWQEIGFVKGNGNSNSPKEYSYTDNTLSNSGKYIYRLKQIDNDGTVTYSNEIETDVTVVLEYGLSQNYPNPFNPTTRITYSIPESGLVTLKVYNIVGEEVAELVNGLQDAGKYEIEFNGRGLSNGVFFYELKANGFTSVKKLILLK